jgi:hypothetical protein
MMGPDNNMKFTTETGTGGERRRSVRHFEMHDAKLFRSGGHGYVPAQTLDWSEGGALVEVMSPRVMRVGERVQLGIGFGQRVLMSGQELRSGRVVRAEACKSGCQKVAVAFEMSQQMAA